MYATLARIVNDQGGFLTAADLDELAQHDRLRTVLVRCNGCRFTTAAQNAQHLLDIIERDFETLSGGSVDRTIAAIQAGADYVRDVSLPAGDPAYNGNYRPVTSEPAPNARPTTTVLAAATARHREHQQAINDAQAPLRPSRGPFREEECSGSFDGFGVVSDADPGL